MAFCMMSATSVDRHVAPVLVVEERQQGLAVVGVDLADLRCR
jgi:hypothetical protein